MHPILFTIPTPWGGVPVYSYGVMLGTSLILAWYFIMWMGVKKEGLDRELMANAFIVVSISSIAAARLLFILTNLDDFDTIGAWFQLRQGGLVAYGGFLGGFVSLWSFMRWKKVPMLALADIVIPTLGSGLLFTRLGCWLYGCDFGRPLGDNAPGWLKSLGTFPKWSFASDASFACDQAVHGSPAWAHHVSSYGLPVDAAASMPVHPTQLYESFVGLLLFGISVAILHKRRFRGQVITITAALYAVWRFTIEYVRDDPERGAAFGFSTSQLISLAMIPACGFAYIHLRKRFLAQGDAPIPESARHHPEADQQKKDGDTAEPQTAAAGASKTRTKKRKKKR